MRRHLRRAGVLTAVLGLLYWTFRDADPERAWSLAAAAGPFAPLVLLPSLVGTGLDVLGWRLVLARLGRRPPFWRLLEARVAADAFHLSLPFGSVWAEGVAAHVLTARGGLTLPGAVAAQAARRCLLAAAHAFYLSLGAALGYYALRALDSGGGSLRMLALGAAAVLLAASFSLVGLLSRGGLGEALLGVAVRAPGRRLRGFCRARAEGFRDTDRQLRLMFGSRRSLILPGLVFLGSWTMESVEAFVLLSFLASGLGFIEVMPIESALSIIRAATIFVPAGWGFQDASYALVLHGLGLEDAATLAAGFTLLRRGKELVWIALGYGLFYADVGRLRTTSDGPTHTKKAPLLSGP